MKAGYEWSLMSGVPLCYWIIIFCHYTVNVESLEENINFKKLLANNWHLSFMVIIYTFKAYTECQVTFNS